MYWKVSAEATFCGVTKEMPDIFLISFSAAVTFEDAEKRFALSSKPTLKYSAACVSLSATQSVRVSSASLEKPWENAYMQYWDLEPAK